MQAELAFHARRAARVVAVTTTRRAARSGALWGYVFGAAVASSAYGYARLYPTAASRAKLAASFSGNAGIAAVLGPARRIETVAGFTAWRIGVVLTVIGAIWGLLAATRMLRGEEDAGRWELFLSGQTTRRGAAAQAICALASGLAALWAATAVLTAAIGLAPKVHFSIGGSLYLAAALVAGAGMFLALGAFVGQLAASRRQANLIGAGVLGAAFLLRMIADSARGLAWLRWASPLGWPEELRPLTGPRPLAFVPIIALIAALVGAAVAVAGRRDLGASALPTPEAPQPRTGLLRGPTGLTIRLTRSGILAWVAGLAILGLVLGLVAQAAGNALSGSATLERAIRRLGGQHGGAAAYLGVAFSIVGLLVSLAAAGQVAAARGEEAEGHLDHLLARPVGRARWLAGRLAIGATLVIVSSVVAGLAAWVGATSQHEGIGIGRLLQAGLNMAPPALFILGVGVLALGLWPRTSTPVVYGLIVWSYLVELVAAAVTTNRWLLDTSVFHHITPAPAADPNWTAAAWLTGLGLLAAVAGVAAFRRRDLVSA